MRQGDVPSPALVPGRRPRPGPRLRTPLALRGRTNCCAFRSLTRGLQPGPRGASAGPGCSAGPRGAGQGRAEPHCPPLSVRVACAVLPAAGGRVDPCCLALPRRAHGLSPRPPRFGLRGPGSARTRACHSLSRPGRPRPASPGHPDSPRVPGVLPRRHVLAAARPCNAPMSESALLGVRGPPIRGGPPPPCPPLLQTPEPGPLASARLTSACGPSAKPSPQQQLPDWQAAGAGGVPGARGAATDWPARRPRPSRS